MRDEDYYREQSGFCGQMAGAAADSDDKSRWLKLAEQWREMAEEVEKQDEAGPHPA
jgi:hypothetical protein